MAKLLLKKWILFLIITVFSFIIGVNTSIVFFHLFFWFLLCFIAINLIWLTVEYFGIRLYLNRKIVNKIDEDGLLEIETLIENKGFLPAFNLVLEDNITCAGPQERKRLFLIEHIGMGSSLNIKYNCICPQRGKYSLGPFSIYIFDPFNLFFLKKTYYNYSELYVYPRTFNIKKFPNLVKGILPWFGIDTIRVSGDEDEFFGTREYKEGDPLRRIHWISTARKNRLIVKEYQRQSFFRATILFNLEKEKNFGKGKERVAEYIIKIAASIAKYLIERGVSLEIIAHAGELVHIPFNKGPEHLEDIFKFLTIAQAQSGVSIGEVFEELSRYLPGDSNLIVITLDRDWKDLLAMLPLEKRNIALIPLFLISSSFLYSIEKQKQEVIKDIEIKLSQKLNFSPIIVSWGDNLEEVFLKY